MGTKDIQGRPIGAAAGVSGGWFSATTPQLTSQDEHRYHEVLAGGDGPRVIGRLRWLPPAVDEAATDANQLNSQALVRYLEEKWGPVPMAAGLAWKMGRMLRNY